MMTFMSANEYILLWHAVTDVETAMAQFLMEDQPYCKLVSQKYLLETVKLCFVFFK